MLDEDYDAEADAALLQNETMDLGMGV
jgi:hypothetical protein